MKINLKPVSVQTVVIFGASSGVGRFTALEMTKRGAKACGAARKISGLKSLVEEIEANGGEAFFVKADAADFFTVKSDQLYENG